MNNRILGCLIAGALATALALGSPAFARGGGGLVAVAAAGMVEAWEAVWAAAGMLEVWEVAWAAACTEEAWEAAWQVACTAEAGAAACMPGGMHPGGMGGGASFAAIGGGPHFAAMGGGARFGGAHFVGAPFAHGGFGPRFSRFGFHGRGRFHHLVTVARSAEEIPVAPAAVPAAEPQFKQAPVATARGRRINLMQKVRDWLRRAA